MSWERQGWKNPTTFIVHHLYPPHIWGYIMYRWCSNATPKVSWCWKRGDSVPTDVLDNKPFPLLIKTCCTAFISLVHWSLCQLPVGCCFRLAPSSEVTPRIAKFQMLSVITNTDAQMRKKPHSFASKSPGRLGHWQARGEESFRQELS